MTKKMVGCEREDGLLNVHPEDETCEVCAEYVDREPAALNEFDSFLANCLLDCVEAK